MLCYRLVDDLEDDRFAFIFVRSPQASPGTKDHRSAEEAIELRQLMALG